MNILQFTCLINYLQAAAVFYSQWESCVGDDREIWRESVSQLQKGDWNSEWAIRNSPFVHKSLAINYSVTN